MISPAAVAEKRIPMIKEKSCQSQNLELLEQFLILLKERAPQFYNALFSKVLCNESKVSTFSKVPQT